MLTLSPLLEAHAVSRPTAITPAPNNAAVRPGDRPLRPAAIVFPIRPPRTRPRGGRSAWQTPRPTRKPRQAHRRASGRGSALETTPPDWCPITYSRRSPSASVISNDSGNAVRTGEPLCFVCLRLQRELSQQVTTLLGTARLAKDVVATGYQLAGGREIPT